MAPTSKVTRRDRKAAEIGEPKKPKLTQEEQDELEEKQLEEVCEKWCGKAIRIFTIGSMLWGLLTSLSEWMFRPPVLLEPVKLVGRLPFVLTGGTEGIGAAAARQLALDGGRLIIGARNMTKGESFVEMLKRETANPNIEARYLDLSKLDTVVDFAPSLQQSEGDGLSGLLNNAAAAFEGCEATIDGFELATQVNYLAPVLLSTLLLPLLEASGDARLVHVTCPAAASARVDLAQLEHMPLMIPDDFKCDGFTRYSSAKLMLNAFSATLSKRRTAAAMAYTSNVFDPGGSVDTPGEPSFRVVAVASRRGFGAIGPHVIIRKVLGYVLAPIFSPIGRFLSRKAMRTATEGGSGLVHLATSPHLKRVSGKYYSLAIGGLTRVAGCHERTRDECGQGKTAGPATMPVGMNATVLWDNTMATLAPWLKGTCAEGDDTCAGRLTGGAAPGTDAASKAPTGSSGWATSEWDEE